MIKRMAHPLIAIASTALALAGMPLLALSASAATTTLTFTGSLDSVPAGTATIAIQAQLPLNVDASGVPQDLEVPTLASVTVSTPSFQISVPDSPTLQQAAQLGHGIVNFRIVVASGNYMTMEYVPASVSASPGTANSAELAAQNAGAVHVPAFPGYDALRPGTAQALTIGTTSGTIGASPTAGGGCVYNRPYGSPWWGTTVVGEAHVAAANGVKDRFWYRYQNDQTMTVGQSVNSPDGGFSTSGTITLTNTLSATGYHDFTSGQVAWVTSGDEYQEYVDICPLQDIYHIEAVTTNSSVNPGSGSPAGNPWSGCSHDPAKVALSPGSGWNLNNSQAQFYSGVFNVFGYSFGGSDGFTQGIEHDYSNPSSSGRWIYICGTRSQPDPTQSPILYNTTG